MKFLFISRTVPGPVRNGSAEHIRDFLLKLRDWLGPDNHLMCLFLAGGDVDAAIKFKIPCFHIANKQMSFYDAPATDHEFTRAGSFIRNHQPDVVIIDYMWLAGLFLTTSLPCLKVIFLHDIHTNILKTLDKKAADLTYPWTAEEEFRSIALADVILTCNDNETATIRERLPDKKVIQVGIAIDCRFVDEPSPGRLLYVGTKNAENVSSLTTFLTKCWPIIRDARPDAFLSLCGTVCEADLPYAENIRLMGQVYDLTHEYEQADCVIVPHTANGGLKLKTAFALAHGKPIVASRCGIDGFPEAEGSAAMVTDEAEMFARYVLQVITSDRLRSRMVRCARQIAINRFAPVHAYGALFHFLKTYPIWRTANES